MAESTAHGRCTPGYLGALPGLPRALPHLDAVGNRVRRVQDHRIPRDDTDDFSPEAIATRQRFVTERTGAVIEHVNGSSTGNVLGTYALEGVIPKGQGGNPGQQAIGKSRPGSELLLAHPGRKLVLTKGL